MVDTDWAIHWLRGQPKVTERLASLQPEGLGLAVISLAELYEGVYGSTNPKQAESGLRNYLTGVEVLLVDEATSQIFGRERGRLRAAHRIISDFDLVIAATALQRNLTLLTNNRRHFERIEGLQFESA